MARKPKSLINWDHPQPTEENDEVWPIGIAAWWQLPRETAIANVKIMRDGEIIGWIANGGCQNPVANVQSRRDAPSMLLPGVLL